MNIVKATIYFIVLEFIVVFSWFAIVVHIKDVINFMVTAVNMPRVTEVGQNVVLGLNIIWLVFGIMWIVWYAYMIHSLTYETTFVNIPSGRTRNW